VSTASVPSEAKPGGTPTEGTTETQTIPIGVGGRVEGISAVLTFSNTFVQAHAGDELDFRMPDTEGDDPHTVTFGTLVEPGINTAEGRRKLPEIFPHKAPDASLQANQSAAQPCYLTTGLPPIALEGGAPACERRGQPDFTGTETFYNSGLLLPGDRFKVRIAASAKPGSYQFMCLVHGGRMTGTLTIADASVPVPRAADVERQGRQVTQGLAFRAAQGRDRPTAATQMLAGVVGQNLPNAYLAEFVPTRLSVVAGQTVSFDVVVAHSIAFNATDDDFGLVRRLPDGTVNLNPRAFVPVDSPTPPPLFTNYLPVLTSGVELPTTTFDGRGFKSSGLLSVDPPGAVSYRVTFTSPGTYEVRCLVHKDMRAQIIVG
jgi:plastocyanin